MQIVPGSIERRSRAGEPQDLQKLTTALPAARNISQRSRIVNS
jgi:hypothetical protein